MKRMNERTDLVQPCVFTYCCRDGDAGVRGGQPAHVSIEKEIQFRAHPEASWPHQLTAAHSVDPIESNGREKTSAMADTAKLRTLFLLFTLVRKRSRRNESNFCRRHFHSPGIELRKIPWNKSRSWKEFFLRSFRSSDLCPIGRRSLSLSLSFE